MYACECICERQCLYVNMITRVNSYLYRVIVCLHVATNEGRGLRRGLLLWYCSLLGSVSHLLLLLLRCVV
jgi:hypothetical protein